MIEVAWICLKSHTVKEWEYVEAFQDKIKFLKFYTKGIWKANLKKVTTLKVDQRLSKSVLSGA